MLVLRLDKTASTKSRMGKDLVREVFQIHESKNNQECTVVEC